MGDFIKLAIRAGGKTDEVLDGGLTTAKMSKSLTIDAAQFAQLRKFLADDTLDSAQKVAQLRKFMDESEKLLDPALKQTLKEKQIIDKALFDTLEEGASKGDELTEAMAKKTPAEKKEILDKADELADGSTDSIGTQSYKWIMANKKTVAASIGFAGLAVTGLVFYDMKNGKKFNIIAIEDVSKGSTIKTMFTIETDQKFSNKGTCRIDGTDCVPIITPGGYKIDSVKEGNKVIIITKEKVTTKGTKGTFTYFTTFEIELAGAVHDVVEGTVAVGAAIATGVGGGVLDGLGLGVSEGTLNIIFYVILGVVALSFGAVMFKMMKKKEGSES